MIRKSLLATGVLLLLSIAGWYGKVTAPPRAAMAQPPAGLPGLDEEERREIKEQARRLGMKPQDLMAAQWKFEREIEMARMKTSPQIVHDGDSLIIVDRPWVYRLDIKTLEIQAVQNLEVAHDRFFEEMERRERN